MQSKLIIDAKGLSKSFGDRVIVSDFSLRVMQGNKIGIVGANGVGKTTLIKLLTGRIAPDAGRVRLSKTMQEVYFDQNRAVLDQTKSLKQTLCPDGGDTVFVRGEPKSVYSYLKEFLFSPAQADTPVSVLSGGEKNRLILARDLAKPSNFLVLDEPTNDLDMDTLDLLQDALESYKGTILIVSHDRDFLDNTATSLLYMAGDGKVVEYVDSCSDLMRKLKEKEQKAAEAAKKTQEKTAKPVVKKEPAAPRMSYKDKRQLEMLPDEIAALENEIKTLEEKLARPDFYAADPAGFEKTAAGLERAKAALDEKETRWLELEMLAQESGK